LIIEFNIFDDNYEESYFFKETLGRILWEYINQRDSTEITKDEINQLVKEKSIDIMIPKELAELAISYKEKENVIYVGIGSLNKVSMNDDYFNEEV